MIQEAKPTRSPDHVAASPLDRASWLQADRVDADAVAVHFGQERAAQLLQRLDLQIHDLLVFTGGRWLDTPDGLLAHFARPVQAVEFALRYQHAIRDFSSVIGLALSSRIAIHANDSAKDSSRSGLGKLRANIPATGRVTVARLFSLALPGQILLSDSVFRLAHGARVELGDRGTRLQWLSHGKYCFVAAMVTMSVHEVGESWLAPLTPPKVTTHIRRQALFWKRPAIVAVAMAGLLVFALFNYFVREQTAPALNFHARDWLVVGGLSNFSGDPRLQDAFDAALRISLDQSRYVNVLSESKVEATLVRMGRVGRTVIDRGLASEIALREGARVVILPTVVAIDGELRVSMEVVDPKSQVSLLDLTAQGRGVASMFDSLDAVNRQLRVELGESESDVRANSGPVVNVSTDNLDALQAFALGQSAAVQSRDDDAIAAYARAIALVPAFALAQMAAARLWLQHQQPAQAWAQAQDARRHREHLNSRYALALDALIARFGSANERMRANKRWAEAFPDAFEAYFDYADAASGDGHQYQNALRFLMPALTEKNPELGKAFALQGRILLCLNKLEQARVAFRQSKAVNLIPLSSGVVAAYAAERDYEGAAQALATDESISVNKNKPLVTFDEVALLLDQGHWRSALAITKSAQPSMTALSGDTAIALRGVQLTVNSYMGKATTRQRRDYLNEQVELYTRAQPIDKPNSAFNMLSAGWLAANYGDADSARLVLEQIDVFAAVDDWPALTSLRAMIEAELALMEKRPEAAVAALRYRLDGSELYASHAVLMRSLSATGDDKAALAQANWLQTQRGLAFGERNPAGLWQAINIVESNLATLSAAGFAAKSNQPEIAREQFASFLRQWPDALHWYVVQERLRPMRGALAMARL